MRITKLIQISIVLELFFVALSVSLYADTETCWCTCWWRIAVCNSCWLCY